MYYLTKIDDQTASAPSAYDGHASELRRQVLVDQSTGSPHMSLSVFHLGAGGHVDAVLHSFETSVYIFSGSLAVTTLGKTVELDAGMLRIATGDPIKIQPVIDALRSRGLIIGAVGQLRQSLEDFFIQTVSEQPPEKGGRP